MSRWGVGGGGGCCPTFQLLFLSSQMGRGNRLTHFPTFVSEFKTNSLCPGGGVEPLSNFCSWVQKRQNPILLYLVMQEEAVDPNFGWPCWICNVQTNSMVPLSDTLASGEHKRIDLYVSECEFYFLFSVLQGDRILLPYQISLSQFNTTHNKKCTTDTVTNAKRTIVSIKQSGEDQAILLN